MKLKPFLLNKTAICTSEPNKMLSQVIYPRLYYIYTIRDVIVGKEVIGLLLHEIHNPCVSGNTTEITFDKRLFTLILHNWEKKASALIEEIYKPNV